MPWHTSKGRSWMKYTNVLLVAALLALLISAPTIVNAKVYALSSSGQLKESIGNSKMLMHISDIQISNNSGQKVVSINATFKNLDFKPQLFNLFFMKLKDTDGREYTPEIFDSKPINVAIPTKDTATAILVFKIPSSTSPRLFSYTEFFSSPLSIDLTKTKNPPDQPPKSEWVLSNNKGFIAKDSRTELTINDEKRSGKFYILDITIKNVGRETLPYNPFYTYAKDSHGIAHSHSFFADLDTPLMSGELSSGDFVRGQVAFEIVSGNAMFIWSGNLGFDSYFNSGTLQSSKSTETTQTIKKETQEKQEYKAKLSLSASLTEKTKSLTISLKNPKNSDATIYEVHLVFPDNAIVKSAVAPTGWIKEIDGDSVTFTTSKKPVEPNKTVKFRLTLDKVVKTLEWDALDEDNNIINSKTTKITIRK
jgi:hypothetical protein